jgi:class 3 adenylate cyclase
MEDNEKKLIELALATQSFNVLWAYYVQSGCNVFDKKCRTSAEKLVKIYNQVKANYTDIGDDFDKEFDKKFIDTVESRAKHEFAIEGIIGKLKTWARNSEEYPYKKDLILSKGLILLLCQHLIIKVCKILEIKNLPEIQGSIEDIDHTENVIRWESHIPRLFLDSNIKELFEKISKSKSIVVVGDIRRSQELMTYSISPEDYSKRIVKFISSTRELITKHKGIFDKFTGDGFIAYFNEHMCGSGKEGYIKCFLKFIEEISIFEKQLFGDWLCNITKMPHENIGLAIGADIGIIEFLDLDNHLVCVGESIVWATRMNSEALASEVVVNNMLYHQLNSTGGIEFAEMKRTTKSGEEFVAWVIDSSKGNEINTPEC